MPSFTARGPPGWRRGSARDAEALAALGTASGENGPAVARRHARAESMDLGAPAVMRLVGAFHDSSAQKRGARILAAAPAGVKRFLPSPGSTGAGRGRERPQSWPKRPGSASECGLPHRHIRKAAPILHYQRTAEFEPTRVDQQLANSKEDTSMVAYDLLGPLPLDRRGAQMSTSVYHNAIGRLTTSMGFRIERVRRRGYRPWLSGARAAPPRPRLKRGKPDRPAVDKPRKSA